MEPNGHNPTQVGGTPPIKLEIILDQSTGAVTVNGPVDNALLCYGLLECGRQTIQNYIAQKTNGSRIVPAASMPLLRH